MATAALKTEKTVHLTLSWEEARTLHRICRRVGGDPKGSRRKHTEAIMGAMETEGVSSRDLDDLLGLSDHLTFYPEEGV